jgi:hypothetical protein
MKLQDISANESIALANILRTERISQFFSAGEKDLSYIYIGPQYQKLQLLTQILTWPFSTIMEHFRLGALVEFEPVELIRLCLALFSDTPLRTKNIAEIEMGHPV